MFETIEALIQNGKLAEAKSGLRAVAKIQELRPNQLVQFFRLCRRVGDFSWASQQLEKMGLIDVIKPIFA